MNNKKTTYWDFIKENNIVIPIIQRDYAQGREGKEDLRKRFLGSLRNALSNSKELVLDFIYGMQHKRGAQYLLVPLDGQQRLTTLWLLHWYAYLIYDSNDNVSENLKILKENFTYETRISSREFCEALCDNFLSLKTAYKNKNKGIRQIVENQTWFMSEWKQDPTVKAMLTMLGGDVSIKGESNSKNVGVANEELSADFIEVVFNRDTCMWEKLIGDKCNIVFYYLPLDGKGLQESDDIYIKMNARGEQLSDFENFKADLIDYIQKQDAKGQTPNQWKSLLHPDKPDKGIPLLMDTEWVDIFWKKNKSIDNKVDEIYFAFLNRFFWNELFIAKKNKDYVLRVGKGDGCPSQENNNVSYQYLNNSKCVDDTSISYNGLDVYKYSNEEIPYQLFVDLKKTMNKYSEYSKSFNQETLDAVLGCAWDSTFRFIPNYLSERENEQGTLKNIEMLDNSNKRIWRVTHLNQIQRIVFFAVCKYFKEEEKEDKVNIEALKHWMRVVWNLVSGEDDQGRPQIRSTSAVRTAIEFIDGLVSHDVYHSLMNYQTDSLSNSDFDNRCKEEIEKAKQIAKDGSWENKIIEAEKFEFFKGSIRFLFQDEYGRVCWETFESKWNNVQRILKKENDKYPLTIELAKYCTDEEIKEIWGKYRFSAKSWKSILLDLYYEPVHGFLMQEQKENFSALYEDIIRLMGRINADRLLKDWQSCKVVLTDYSARRNEPSNGWVFEVGNATRNHWNNLVKKINSVEIQTPQAYGDESYDIDSQTYYRGLWTNIKFNDQYFRYFGNNTVCLMNKDWNGKRLIKESVGEDASNTYYCCIDDTETEKSFLKKLEDLLNRLNR